MSIRTEQVDRYQTVFEVWERILDGHPEIVKQTVKEYAERPHGISAYQHVEVLPIERVKYDLDERFFYGDRRQVRAIGAMVEVLPNDFDPSLEYSEWAGWAEGATLEIDSNRARAFIFMDFESDPTQDFLGICVGALKHWDEDWYLLDSGNSLHLIVNSLVLPEALPVCFGRLIDGLANEIRSVSSPIYSAIGGYLTEFWYDKQRLIAWAGEVGEKFGHKDGPMGEGKMVFPADMKYIAHVVEGVANGRRDQGFLRVSAKNGSIPVLVAQQVKGEVTVYESSVDPFDRRQLPLLI